MNFSSKFKIMRGEMAVAPFVDVMFLLLIFFLLGTSFNHVRGIKSLSKVDDAQMIATTKLFITIRNDNGVFEYYLNNIKQTATSLEENLAKELKFMKGNPSVALYVDQDVPIKVVHTIYPLTRKYKFNLVHVVDEK